jgi:hypothetical protein
MAFIGIIFSSSSSKIYMSGIYSFELKTWEYNIYLTFLVIQEKERAKEYIFVYSSVICLQKSVFHVGLPWTSSIMVNYTNPIIISYEVKVS